MDLVHRRDWTILLSTPDAALGDRRLVDLRMAVCGACVVVCSAVDGSDDIDEKLLEPLERAWRRPVTAPVEDALRRARRRAPITSDAVLRRGRGAEARVPGRRVRREDAEVGGARRRCGAARRSYSLPRRMRTTRTGRRPTRRRAGLSRRTATASSRCSPTTTRRRICWTWRSRRWATRTRSCQKCSRRWAPSGARS